MINVGLLRSHSFDSQRCPSCLLLGSEEMLQLTASFSASSSVLCHCFARKGFSFEALFEDLGK